MSAQLALRPDLVDCVLEDRTLMATGFMPAPFFLTSPFSNSFIIPGTGGSSGPSGTGFATYPGLTLFNMALAGVTNYINSNILLGVSGGSSSSVSISNMGGALSGAGGGGAAVGGGGGGGGSASGDPSSTHGPTLGYGANISTGFNFALSSANNFGVSATALGSVPVHSYGDTAERAPETRFDPNNPDGSTSSPSISSNAPKLGVTTQGPSAVLGRSALIKNPIGTSGR